MTIRGIVLAGFLTVLIAGCTPPMPPDVLAARAEAQVACGTGEVRVSVPTGFSGAMDAVGAALSSVCPDETVFEVPVDESAPLALVDKTPSPADIEAFKATSCPDNPVIVVPAFAYPVTLAYNVVGLEGLFMTPQIVSGILSGAITSWEDPLLLEANPDFDLTLLPQIALMSIDAPQGDVEAMTTWLIQQDPASWPQGKVGMLEMGQSSHRKPICWLRYWRSKVQLRCCRSRWRTTIFWRQQTCRLRAPMPTAKKLTQSLPPMMCSSTRSVPVPPPSLRMPRAISSPARQPAGSRLTVILILPHLKS